MIKAPKLEGGSSLLLAYTEMVTALRPFFTGDSDSPKLVIGFDEAHPLAKLSSKGFRPSHILCKIIHSYSSSYVSSMIWVVFASTTSQVGDFSAHQPIR